MIISPFSSIFFLGERKTSGNDCPEVQIFSPSDKPIVEVIRLLSETVLSCVIKNIHTGISKTITPASSAIGGEIVDVYTLSLENLSDGYYYVMLGEECSEPFRITTDTYDLEQSVLFRYSPHDNRGRRDVVAIAGEQRVVFEFRVQGGFKDNGVSFTVDNEQFLTQEADLVELYGRESTQQTLTVGLCCGVPIWFGELLNRLLTCRYVFIDGKRYTRYQQSVPEITQTMDGVDAFVFTQQLSRVKYLQPQSL